MRRYQRGFTLIEILTAIAIMAILAAIALPFYLSYRAKASAADIIATHEELQEIMYAESAQGTDDCSDLLQAASASFLKGHSAELAIDFVTVPDGSQPGSGSQAVLDYRPVLRVCAEADKHGKYGVKAATIAYAEFKAENSIQSAAPDPPGKTMAFYNVDLTGKNTPVCKGSPPAPSTGCTGSAPPAPLPAKPAVASQSPAPAPAPTPAPAPAPAPSKPPYDKDKPMSKDNNPCPDGQVLSGPGGSCVDLPQAAKYDPNWDPYAPRKCEVCSGPPRLCDRLHHETTCVWPNNVCSTIIKNFDSGARDVERKCNNAENALHDWYQQSSSDDKCTTLDTSIIQTLAFECTYACVTDGCNLPLNPLEGKTYDEQLKYMYIPN